MDDQQREPLAAQNSNVATVRPITSKIPTPGKTKLPQTQLSVASNAAGRKRICDDGVFTTEVKKSKLNDSICSNASDSSVGSYKSNVSANSSRTNLSRAKSASHTGVNNIGAKAPASKARNPANARKTSTSSTARVPISSRPPPGRPAAAKKPTTANNATKTSTAAPASKKRPAWDLKGRLQDMEQIVNKHLEHNGNLKTDINDHVSRISNLRYNNEQLEGALEMKEKQCIETTSKIQDLECKLRISEQEVRDSSRKYQGEIEDLKFSASGLERQKNSLEGELQASRTEVSGLQSTVASLTSAQAGIKAQLEANEINLNQSVADGKLKDCEITRLKQLVAVQEEKMENMSGKIREFETDRRKLHNTIQELKGNIRVFCRVRPLLGEELTGNDGSINHMHFPTDDPRMLELEKIGEVNPNDTVCSNVKKGQNSYEFAFDRVFNPRSSQADVFEEISQLVQSSLDGYNVCIFAYGQTGSGKTFTMEGPPSPDIDTEGMIPRSVRQIFSSAHDLEDKGWIYTFEASFLEIYNETIRDLLGKGDETKHEIKMVQAKSSETHVTNITTVEVTSEDKVYELLKKASVARAVAETKCNERSSRSHSVFRLKLIGQNKHTSESCSGLLNLVDLAGSERLKDSGSQGARLKETQCINKSLANLGNVIMALANKDQHVPYRNSKLTHLLQNSLGGNSKTLMFVNVSPVEECFHESLNSLRFATKVNNCNIGSARKRKCS